MTPPDPILTPGDAERLAKLIALIPAPDSDETTLASRQYREGFDRAKQLAIMLVMASCGEADPPSGCAPVASR